jgi:hypothetical protein
MKRLTILAAIAALTSSIGCDLPGVDLNPEPKLIEVPVVVEVATPPNCSVAVTPGVGGTHVLTVADAKTTCKVSKAGKTIASGLSDGDLFSGVVDGDEVVITCANGCDTTLTVTD